MSSAENFIQHPALSIKITTNYLTILFRPITSSNLHFTEDIYQFNSINLKMKLNSDRENTGI